MKKHYLIFALFLFLILSARAQNPFIKNYSIADGLPTNKIYCVYKDSKDFMWFGTDAGVFRFDGSHFVNFGIEEGLRNNMVLKVKEDFSGRLWFMTFGGSVNYYDNGKIYNEENTPFLGDLKSNFMITDFFQDNDSTLYFYNAISEVFVIKDNEFIDYKDFKLNNKKDQLLYYINKSSDNKFLLWSAAGIYEINHIDSDQKFYPHSTPIQRTFYKNKNESIGLDLNGNLQFYKNTEISNRNVLHSNSQTINSILIDSENYVWISTYDRGISCYKNDSLVLHLDIEKARNLISDKENNIWIVSVSEGIFKINRDILKYRYLNKDWFKGKGITALASSTANGIWATNGSSFFMIEGNEIVNTTINIDNEIITNIYHLKNNTLLTSGNGTSLFVFNNITKNETSGLIESDVPIKQGYRMKNIIVDKDEEFLYSYINNEITRRDLQKNFDGLEILRFTKTRINNLFLDHDEKIIFNGYGRFYFLGDFKKGLIEEKDLWSQQNTVLEPYNKQIFFSHITINDNYDLYNFAGNQLILSDSSRSYNLISEFESQIDFQIKDMIFVDSTLFFFTAKTIYTILNPLNIMRGDTLEINRLNIDFSFINDIYYRNNILYVGSDNGLTCIPISEIVNTKLVAPKPYISNISLDEKNYNLSSNQVEFKNKSRLSIEFASLNYSAIPSNYSFKLEGVNEDWITGNETRIVYLNLSPGNYTFKLKARKSRGNYSETIELPIVIQPTTFQRPIIKIAFVLLLFGLVFLLIRYFYKSKIKKQETDTLLITLENKALQSMMNPHFIFNALGSIQRYLLENKSTEAGTYLSQFARLIRQNMNALKANFITIEDEVERLRNYIDLEKFRMDNKFEYEIDVDSKIDDYDACIPSMIVQPFVENAIWHGVSSINEQGKITIRFNKIDEKSILITIEDNGIGMAKSGVFSKSEHNLNMGVSLTRKRLQLIGERNKVNSQITSSELNPGDPNPGTKIELIVPLV